MAHWKNEKEAYQLLIKVCGDSLYAFSSVLFDLEQN